jgi:Flp pilus assembly protein CpaB
MKITTRSWQVIGALALASLAGLLTIFYVTNYKRHVQQGEAMTTVLVAAHDLAPDTTGAKIVSSHAISAVTVPHRAVVAGAISAPDQIRNLVLVQPIYAGEQITLRRFAAGAQQGVRAQLQGGLRAFQLPGDPNQLLAGTLRAGDHVDVVASWEYPEGGQTHVSAVVLTNLLVLSPAASPGKASGLNPAAQTVSAQIALTDLQSVKLEWVIANAQWHLELRPTAGSIDNQGPVLSSAALDQAGSR